MWCHLQYYIICITVTLTLSLQVQSIVSFHFSISLHLKCKFSDCISLLITLKHPSGLCTECQICRQQQEQKKAILAVSSILSDQHTAGLSSCAGRRPASTKVVFDSGRGPSIIRHPSFERGFGGKGLLHLKGIFEGYRDPSFEKSPLFERDVLEVNSVLHLKGVYVSWYFFSTSPPSLLHPNFSICGSSWAVI